MINSFLKLYYIIWIFHTFIDNSYCSMFLFELSGIKVVIKLYLMVYGISFISKSLGMIPVGAMFLFLDHWDTKLNGIDTFEYHQIPLFYQFGVCSNIWYTELLNDFDAVLLYLSSVISPFPTNDKVLLFLMDRRISYTIYILTPVKIF